MARMNFFIPLKTMISLIVAFIIAVMIVLITVSDYKDIFVVNNLYWLLFSPIGGFSVMKLHLVIPMISGFYLIILIYKLYRP